VKYRDTLLDGGILLFCKIVTFPDGITRVSRTTRAIGGLAKNQQLPKNTKKRLAAHLRKTRRYRSTHMRNATFGKLRKTRRYRGEVPLHFA
jgi:hypothetical protein